MKICYVSDSKAGHAAQARGLLAALKRQLKQKQQEPQLLELSIQQCSKFALISYWLSKGHFGKLPETLNTFGRPNLIIVVGHSTHWTGLLLKKCFPTSKLLVLMQPSLPVGWFDYLIIPRHDHPPVKADILVTEGVLNPLVNEKRHQPDRNLILIGGPSKRHGWSEAGLITQLQQVVEQVVSQQYADEQLILTTSRRTPSEFLQQEFLKKLSTEQYPQVTVYPVEQTPTGWLFEQLQLASVVWVTEDSVSMLYEALTAGCEVHLIQMPRLKQDRITCAVDNLLAQGLVKSLSKKAIDSGHNITLNEADRAARWLIHHLQG